MRTSTSLLGCLMLVGCAHVTNLESLGTSVTFEGGRLNGAPVVRDTVQVGDFRLLTESSVFVYEVAHAEAKEGNLAWNNAQAAFAITLADGAAWALGPDEQRRLATEVAASLAQALPDATCQPVLEAEAMARVACQRPVGEATVHFAAQVGAGPRGLLLLLGCWSNDQGRGWVERFLRSAHALKAPVPGPGGAPAVTAPLPDGALASRLVQRVLTAR